MTYAHAFTFGFATTGSEDEEGNVPGATLRQRIIEKLQQMTDDEIVENCGAPFATFEELS